MTNVIGQIRPCHKPSQKPATLADALPGMFVNGFGPAAQAAKNNIASRQKTLR